MKHDGEAASAHDNEVNAILKNIADKIQSNTGEECREDLKVIILSLVGFFAQESPEMFAKDVTEEFRIKKFFKTIISVGTDYMLPFKAKANKEKMEKFMKLFPVIQKYSNVE